jgi:hypothetical protein
MLFDLPIRFGVASKKLTGRKLAGRPDGAQRTGDQPAART